MFVQLNEPMQGRDENITGIEAENNQNNDEDVVLRYQLFQERRKAVRAVHDETHLFPIFLSRGKTFLMSLVCSVE